MTVTPVSMPMNSARCVGRVPSEAGTGCWRASEPARPEREDHRNEPGAEHHHTERGVVPVRVDAYPRERRTVVVAGRGERVEHLRQPMRAAVQHCRPFTWQCHRQRRPGQNERGGRQQVERRELHLATGDLLAQILGRAPDHQPRDEHRDGGQNQHAVQATAGAAGCDLTELHVDEQYAAAKARVGVVGRVDGTGRRQRRRRRERRGVRDAEACFLALHRRADTRRHRAVVGEFGCVDADHTEDRQQCHHGNDGEALSLVAHHPAERARQRKGDHQQEVDLEPVGPAGRILERMRRVGVVRAAAVRPDLLDGLL